MSDAENGEAITANAERAIEVLSKKLEHRELITEEEARRSRQFILEECNKGAATKLSVLVPASSGSSRQ
jgi:hypothetical protein